MTWGYVAVGAATIIGGAMGANATEDASDAANAASQRAVDESGRQFDLVREDSRIARETGNDALRHLGYALGIRQVPSEGSIARLEAQISEQEAMLESSRNATTGGLISSGSTQRDRYGHSLDRSAPARPADLGAIEDKLRTLKAKLKYAKQDFKISKQYEGGMGEFIRKQPGYQFGMDEGMKGVTNLLSVSGQGQGGKAIKAAMRFGEDYAGSKVDEHLGRLFTLAGYGPVGVNQSAAAGQGVAQAAQSQAAVAGQGAYNVAGANTGAVNNAINTGMTLWSYNNMMNNRTPPPPSGINTVPQGNVPYNVGATA